MRESARYWDGADRIWRYVALARASEDGILDAWRICRMVLAMEYADAV